MSFKSYGMIAQFWNDYEYDFKIVLYSQVLKVNPQVYKHKQSEIVSGMYLIFLTHDIVKMVKVIYNSRPSIVPV